MADTRYQTQTRTGTQAQIDQGLRSYMMGVYNYMALGRGDYRHYRLWQLRQTLPHSQRFIP